MNRFFSFSIAAVFALQSTTVGATGSGHHYREQVEHFFSVFQPDTVWEPAPKLPESELERLWKEAIEKEQGQLFTNGFNDIERSQHFDWWIERLRRSAFFGESAQPGSAYYANHPLDTYGLLGQTVHTKLVETKFSKIRRVTTPIKNTTLGVAKLSKGITHGFSEATLAAMGIETESIASASADEVRDLKGFTPTFRREAYFTYVDPTKLVIELVNSQGHVVKALGAKGQDVSFLYKDRSVGARSGERSFQSRQGALSPRLVYQGQVLHEFKNQLTAVAMFDRYLVFLEPNRTFKDKGLINLSFIDLDYFHTAVGKTVLPIFRLPLHVGEAVHRPEDLRLEVTAEGVSVDGKLITGEVWDFFSWMQQLTFNTTVSLVDERFYQSTVKVLESLVEQFDRALQVTGSDLNDQMLRAGVSFDLFEKFRSDLMSQLKLRADLGAGGAREVDRSKMRLEADAMREFDRLVAPEFLQSEEAKELLNEKRIALARERADLISQDVKGHVQRAHKFGQDLAADQAFQATLQGYNNAIASQRKLTNRLNMFLTRVIMPQPLGAPKIQQALGFVAASVTSKDSWKTSGIQRAAMTLEGVKELLANRKSRVSLEVMAGAMLATLYPAEAGQFMFHSLEVGQNLLTNFLGWVDNWGKITSGAWHASMAGWDFGKLYEVYFTPERFPKFMTGVSVLLGSLLVTAVTLHVLVNGTHFAKAMSNGEWKKQREEGRGFWSSLKNGFVSYVRKDKKKYYDALSRAEKKRRGQDITISLANGDDFKGLFRSIKKNDFEALSTVERNRVAFDVELTIPDGRLLKGKALPPGEVSSDGVRMRMELPDGSFIDRAIRVADGDWAVMGDDELLHEGVGAELRLPKATLAGVMQNTEWTAGEEKMLTEALEKAEEKDKLMDQKLAAIQRIPVIGRLFRSGKGDIETLKRALTHFIVGFSSWTHSTKLFGKIWNPWFLLRNFWIRPRAWFTMMAYPNLFNRMVWNNGVATYYDGGKRLFTESFNAKKVGAFIAQFPYYAGVDPELKQLEEFEKAVIPVEQQLHKAALKQAFVHLTEVAVKDKDFIYLLSQGANLHPFDKKIKRLNKKLKVYFEAYFVNAFESALRIHLTRISGFDEGMRLSKKELKAHAVDHMDHLPLSDAKAEELVRRAILVDRVEEKAQKAAHEFVAGFAERRRLAHWRKIGLALDSKFNGTLERYKVAETQMNNDEAMARATRQYMVGLIVDKPIELLLTFMFLAGIDEGVLKPLHDEQFSENSFWYTSRYVMWNGYFTGIMISLLADVWMKIQMDSRVDALGGFDSLPTEEDAKKSFLSYYRKNFFADNNKWWDNQKFEVMIAYRNMPAYFMTAAVTNLLALGRFDLDSFISVYKGALLPTGGLYYKMENAFEMSTSYVMKDIPQKFHMDPRVQEYRNKRVGRLRFAYNFIYKTFYENPLGNIMGNWMTMPIEGIGPRAWMRQFYPGQLLPTEAIVNYGLRPLQASGVPSLANFADTCDALLTTNHTDAFKIKPKVGK